VPQFLASRRYVVVEPEFRGSAGYGIDHQVAGWRQWGLAMQDDMLDALQWAIAQGIVDGSRVCIMGASYGGFAALMGPVRYPEAYRCAISWVAPTDLPKLVSDWRSEAGMNKAKVRELEARIGTEEQLRETSPVNRVSQLRVPVLAAWGVDDERVPIAHGRSFRDAARAAKVELEYVEYAQEGHVWMKPSNRIDFFGRAEKLLARTLGSP
jgi:dipeptidyl aminopeptidase/acylaminoacyl peptidase